VVAAQHGMQQDHEALEGKGNLDDVGGYSHLFGLAESG
jgi:hypothetical protein